MKKDEVNLYFKSWQDYVEIADKLSKIFNHVPESFLPYPKNILEEALNIKAKELYDLGDLRMSDNIKEGMALWLGSVESDEQALISMNKILNLILNNEELKEAMLNNLKISRNSWIQHRLQNLK